jgi:hypothetical protein
MAPNRSALALLLLGLVLLPAPAYAIGLERIDAPERHRSSTGYRAPAVDVTNDSALAQRYAKPLAFQPGDLEYSHIARNYEAPNRTRSLLERAIENPNGTATTDNAEVGSDLRRLEREYPYLTVSFDTYYAYSVSTTAETTTIEVTRANGSAVAATIRSALVVSYENLSPAEQTTFRKIRNATESAESYDYRPWADEPVPEKPIVAYQGSHYAVRVGTHVDDIDFPDGLFLGLVASGVGLLCLLAAAGVWLYGRLTG